MNLQAKLAALNLSLPTPPKPVAAYVPAMRAGGLLFVSGQLPFRQGELLATGPVPREVSIERAQGAARQCVLNGLAIADAEMGGDWYRFMKVVRLGVFVLSVDGFADQPKVANGASELLQEIFGPNGRHARAAVGVNALPLNASVEVELCLEVR